MSDDTMTVEDAKRELLALAVRENPEGAAKLIMTSADNGYIGSNWVQRYFGGEQETQQAVTAIIFNRPPAEYELQFEVMGMPDGVEDYKAEFQEYLDNTDSSGICNTSQFGNNFGDWVTVLEFEVDEEESIPEPEEVFSNNTRDLILYNLAVDSGAPAEEVQKALSVTNKFRPRRSGRARLRILRNGTSRDDVGSNFYSQIRYWNDEWRMKNRLTTQTDGAPEEWVETLKAQIMGTQEEEAAEADEPTEVETADA